MTAATPDTRKAVVDWHGELCLRAEADSYPLAAMCAHCGRVIRVADASAEWVHAAGGQTRCEP